MLNYSTLVNWCTLVEGGAYLFFYIHSLCNKTNPTPFKLSLYKKHPKDNLHLVGYFSEVTLYNPLSMLYLHETIINKTYWDIRYTLIKILIDINSYNRIPKFFLISSIIYPFTYTVSLRHIFVKK